MARKENKKYFQKDLTFTEKDDKFEALLKRRFVK